MFENWDKADRLPAEDLIQIILTVANEVEHGDWYPIKNHWSEIENNVTNWETLNAGLYGVTNSPEYGKMKQMMRDASRRRLKALELNCRMFAKFFKIFKCNGKKEEFLEWYNTVQPLIADVGEKAMRNATLHITDDYRDNALSFILELFEIIYQLNTEKLKLGSFYTKIGQFGKS